MVALSRISIRSQHIDNIIDIRHDSQRSKTVHFQSSWFKAGPAREQNIGAVSKEDGYLNNPGPFSQKHEPHH